MLPLSSLQLDEATDLAFTVFIDTYLRGHGLSLDAAQSLHLKQEEAVLQFMHTLVDLGCQRAKPLATLTPLPQSVLEPAVLPPNSCAPTTATHSPTDAVAPDHNEEIQSTSEVSAIQASPNPKRSSSIEAPAEPLADLGTRQALVAFDSSAPAIPSTRFEVSSAMPDTIGCICAH